MATPRPQQSDYDSGGEFAAALREWNAANAPGDSPVYSMVETEVSRVDNGDGTFTVTYRGSTDPSAPTYTKIVGTKIVTAAPPDFSNATNLYNALGPRVTGAVQTYIDEVYAGVQSGKYSVADAENALNIIGLQADQGMTGAYGTAQGVVAVAPKDDGTGTGTGTGTGVPGKDARSTINALLATFGLGDLGDYVYKLIGSGEVNLNNPDAIIFSLRGQPAYQKRFSANTERVKNGFDELDPASYIALEDQYRATLSANGMPVSFYDSKDDFDALIGGSVSNAELQSRIQDGYRAVEDADPEVKRQMYELGFAQGDLAAYFIDPNRMRPTLVAADYKRQAEAAKIAARGLQSAGIQLSGGLAEDLARRGVTETQAQTGFTAIGKLGELTTQMSGEAALSQEQIVGQQFGTDVAAAQELDKRKRRRVGEFAGGGSFARTQGETSGSVTTSIGKAQ